MSDTSEREEALAIEVAEWLTDATRNEKAVAMSWFRAGWESARREGAV